MGVVRLDKIWISSIKLTKGFLLKKVKHSEIATHRLSTQPENPESKREHLLIKFQIRHQKQLNTVAVVSVFTRL
jgi:hypothetical protein